MIRLPHPTNLKSGSPAAALKSFAASSAGAIRKIKTLSKLGHLEM
jgi:hypothetical protein